MLVNAGRKNFGVGGDFGEADLGEGEKGEPPVVLSLGGRERRRERELGIFVKQRA